MKRVDHITDRGTAVWGGQTYEIELFVRDRSWANVSGTDSKTLRSFGLNVNSEHVGGREFGSEQARTEFMSASFSESGIQSVAPIDEVERAHPLAELIGEDLAIVTFVMDYIQLNFNGPPLSLYVRPRIIRGVGRIEPGTAGYADALVDMINLRLVGVDEMYDLGLVLDFADGTRLSIPFDDPEAAGPEVAYFGEFGLVWPTWPDSKPAIGAV